MIHGVGLKLECWTAQLKFLSKKYTIIAIDLPGHGYSSNLSIKPINLNSYVQQIKLFTDEVIETPFLIIGHSLGALISIIYAHDYPKNCTGIVALNCIYQRSLKSINEIKLRYKKLASKKMEQEINITIDRWFGKNPNSYYLKLANICRQWLYDSNKQGYLEAYNIFANQTGVSEQILKKINIPIAFITGSFDLNSTPLMSRDMANLCNKGVSKEIIGAGHMAQMSHSKEVNETISLFVSANKLMNEIE